VHKYSQSEFSQDLFDTPNSFLNQFKELSTDSPNIYPQDEIGSTPTDRSLT